MPGLWPPAPVPLPLPASVSPSGKQGRERWGTYLGIAGTSPAALPNPRADSDLFTCDRTFCSTYLTRHLSVCLKPGTFPFRQARRARRYVCSRDKPLLCASSPLRLRGVWTLSLRYRCKIHPEKPPHFSLPPSPRPSQACTVFISGTGSRKVTLFRPGRPSASQLPSSVAASVMHVCIC